MKLMSYAEKLRRQRARMAARTKPRKPIAKGKPPRRRNQQRHDREWTRAYHSEERVLWVKDQRCVATKKFGADQDPIVNAHVARIGEKGTSYKGSYVTVVPMRHSAHVLLHNDPEEFFTSYPHLSAERLAELALETQQKWLAHEGANA